MTSINSSFLDALKDYSRVQKTSQITRSELVGLANTLNVPVSTVTQDRFRVRHGVYSIDSILNNTTPEFMAPSAEHAVTYVKKNFTEKESLVPVRDATYVPFGHYTDLKKIISAKIFYPTYIVGLSGNGKTTMVEQVCAALKREAIRVNITIETDEDDLIGGQTLVNGNIVYREGPVLTAMRRGAVLILDEIDRGSNKLMCLQSILEGKPYYNKKTLELIQAAPGFNVVATANTKGTGVEESRYMSAQILDEAFLERFAVTFQQEYPPVVTEKKILLKKMVRVDKVDEEFALKLVSWADAIRRTFKEGGLDDIVSTRRLEHIVNAYALFGSRMKAINMSISRFSTDTKQAFIDLYTKIDETVTFVSENSTEEALDVEQNQA